MGTEGETDFNININDRITTTVTEPKPKTKFKSFPQVTSFPQIHDNPRSDSQMSTLSKRKSSILDDDCIPIEEDALEYALEEENYNSNSQEEEKDI